MGDALIIGYAVIAVTIPILATILDGPDPDPMVFVFACFFGLLWPVYAPFVLLWWAAKGLGRRVHVGKNSMDGLFASMTPAGGAPPPDAMADD